RGLINAQFAVKDGVVYCLEVNPRASRTVTFSQKSRGCHCARVWGPTACGESLSGKHRLATRPATCTWWGHDQLNHVALKEAVLPFGRFPGVDMILGPEMRSTGEVMGIDAGLGLAFAKSQAAGGWGLPTKGTVFVSVADRDKLAIVACVQLLSEMGFDVVSTA